MLPGRDGGEVGIDLFALGELGVAGRGAPRAMYALLAGLLSEESCPDVRIIGAGADLSLLTGLPIGRFRVPGPREFRALSTHAEALRVLCDERARIEEGDGPSPYLILLSFTKCDVQRDLPDLVAPRRGRRRVAAILVPCAPHGLTCTLDEDGGILEVQGSGPDEELRASLARVRFAQLDLDEGAALFVEYLAGAIARYETHNFWDDLP
ncbi:hypothetical protein [Actinomadura hibisca]|uniref:hypothetical protein n=1 Tax=Actinomadura hibisca TaxID=68565 RepID=UPI00082B5A2F|nr:hypothetical protein [Actinomadura hibisca]